MTLARKIFNFARSIKLTIFLITYIIVTSVIASMIPQGLEQAYYHAQFNPFFARIILFFHVDRFYYSVAFFFPAVMFMVNITSCTIYRIYHGRKIRKRNHGPDLVHIGLLFLLIGGVYSLFDREENVVYLGVGDAHNVRNGYQIVLKDFTIETYDSGMIRDWISDVEIRRYGSFIRRDKIEVNHPCTFDQYTVYQFTYRKILNAIMQDENGERFSLNQGSVISMGDANYMFSDIMKNSDDDEPLAVFHEFHGDEKTGKQMELAEHKTIGHYRLVSVRADFVSGLNIVKDNSHIILFLAIFLMIIGLMMTYYRDVFKGDKE